MNPVESDLRKRGFRPVSSDLLQHDDMTKLAATFGYEILKISDTTWLRRRERGRGIPLEPAIMPGPTIRRTDVSDPNTYDFLQDYRRTSFAKEQDKLVQFTTHSLRASLAKGLESSESFRRWHSLVRILFFSNSIQLRSVLEDSALPAFFERDPDGRVQVFMLKEGVERHFGLLRAAYALSHYSLARLRASGQRFASLVEWDAAVPNDYLEGVLSITQASTYPHVQMFHGGPFGLSFSFVLSMSFF